MFEQRPAGSRRERRAGPVGEGPVRRVAGKGSPRSGVWVWASPVKLGLGVLRMGRRARKEAEPREEYARDH